MVFNNDDQVAKLKSKVELFSSNICSAIVLAAVRCRKINGLVYEAACICNAYRDRNTLCKFEITLILNNSLSVGLNINCSSVLNFIYFGQRLVPPTGRYMNL